MIVNSADLTILRYPAPALRMPAKLIARVDDNVKAVAQRMIDLMHEAKGVGLAAPQVGLPWRMFVTHPPDEDAPTVYINPRLTNLGQERDVYEEGCLSLPGIHVEIERPRSVRLTAIDLNQVEITVSSHGFPARVWQHEFDHLNGVLIIDKLSAKDRQEAVRTLKTNGSMAFSREDL